MSMKEIIKSHFEFSSIAICTILVSVGFFIMSPVGASNCAAREGSGVDWSGCEKVELNLTNANLTNANLRGVNFSGTDLTGADLSGADLTGANLTRAILKNAKLQKSGIPAIFVAVNLTDSNLESTEAYGVNFSKSNIVNSNFTLSKLDNAKFTDCIMQGVRFSSASLQSANFSNVDLRKVSFKGVYGNMVILDGANLSFLDLSFTNLENSKLHGTNLTGANIEGTRFAGADASDVNFDLVKGAPLSLPSGWFFGGGIVTTDRAAADKAAADKVTNQILDLRRQQINDLSIRFSTLLKSKPELSVLITNAIKALDFLNIHMESNLSDQSFKQNLSPFERQLEGLEKIKTITCAKGTTTKKVTGVSPKCPAQYKKK